MNRIFFSTRITQIEQMPTDKFKKKSVKIRNICVICVLILQTTLRHSERSEESLAKSTGIAGQAHNDGVFLIINH